MVSNDVYLPSYEELTVEEIPLSTPYLRAGAAHLGLYCEDTNNEFMLCRQETNDIRACLNEGKAVTKCSLEFFRKVKKTCFNEFQEYAECLDKSSGHFDPTPCKKTQAVLDLCFKNNFGLDRPNPGYHCKPKIYKGNRPKPEPVAPQVFENAPKDRPEMELEGRAKYGSRLFWIE